MNAQDNARPIDVSPELLESWLESGDTVLIDVREDFEHASERIGTAHHFALSAFNPNQIRDLHGAKRVVFHCRSGKRSADAASRYASEGEETFHLQGGIEAWKASGRQTLRSASAPRIDVMRQVQIAAGLIVLAGVILGVLVSPWLLGLSAFVGAGLTFAGLTGWCGLAMLLSRMPWNRAPVSSCTPAAASAS